MPTLLDSSKLGNYTSIKEIRLSQSSTTIIVNTHIGEQIYVFGYNNSGQLGIGNTSNQINPILFDTNIFGNYILIKKINFTSQDTNVSHAIITDDQGKDKIFVWGQNNAGQLGNGNLNNQTRPILFDTTRFGSNVKIREFDITYNVGYVILERDDGKNELYTWGFNSYGQVGVGIDPNTNVSIPTKVNIVSGQNIKFVKSLSFVLIIVITSNGIDELYTCGAGGWGQLAHGGTSNPGNVTSPKRVPQSLLGNATEIIQINGSYQLFASVKINGQLKFFAWGNNGQYIMNNSSNTVWLPKLIDNSMFGNFTEVYNSVFTTDLNEWQASSCYAYVKTALGDKLYVWGNNNLGSLGVGSNSLVIIMPTEVITLDLSTAKITKFPDNFNQSNILKLERNNQIEYFGSGYNNFGQLAQNNTTNISTFKKILPYKYTNPIPKITNFQLTSIEALNLINPNNVLNTTELEKYLDITSFPNGSTLSIDMAKTTTNLEQGILNIAITTNKYDSPLVIDTITAPKTFEVAINGLWKATNINTNPIFVRETSFPNQDKITIKELYDTICNSAGKVINRQLLEQYLDLTSIPPTAELYLLPNSLDDPINATFTLKSNKAYLNGITTVQAYTQPNLTISLEEIMNWVLIISLSVVGGALLIAALVGFILVKRNSNRIII